MLAQTVTAEPIVSLLQYGAIAFFAVAFIMGWVIPKPSLTQAAKQYEDTIRDKDVTINRLVGEKNEVLKEIRQQVSGVQTDLKRLHDDTEELTHMVETLGIRLMK